MTLLNQQRRFIPSIQVLLSTPPVVDILKECPRWAVLQETRKLVQEIRDGDVPLVSEQSAVAPWRIALGEIIASRARVAAMYSLRRVINATGVVLHTNLGRALLAERAIEHMVSVARNYSNLEFDLKSGQRGSRYDHVRDLICELTGAEDAIVVNNNAAAVVLTLSELAAGREVIVARGELVEIGGSFRIPEIMELSGCTLKEIGTTNRVHLSQYEDAINENTALLLKVHTSNYRVIGFTASVEVSQLAGLARSRGLPIMNDLGCGCLVDMQQFGIPHEQTVQEALASGSDVVTFSGDKLLGGPQIGVIAGRTEIVSRLRRNQFLRALRVDKLTLAALEGTLRIYRDSQDPVEEVPALRALGLSVSELKKRALHFAGQLRSVEDSGGRVRVISGESIVGAGSAPESGLATHLVAITHPSKTSGAIEEALRDLSPAVLARVANGDICIDLRTVAPREENELLGALVSVLGVGGRSV